MNILMKKYLVILLLFCISTVKSQEFEVSYPKKIDSLLSIGFYDEAIDFLRDSISALDSKNKLDSLEFELARLYAINYDLDSSFFYLEKSIRVHKNLDVIENQDFVALLYDEERWYTFVDDVFDLQKITFKSKKHRTYTKLLSKMLIEDQAFFPIHSDVVKKLNLDRNIVRLAKHVYSDLISKRHEEDMSKIIKAIGLPQNKDFPIDVELISFLIIQHGSQKFMEQSYPMIKKAYKKGKFDKVLYAFVTDRMRLWKGECQLYGTQYKRLKSGENVMWNVCDKEKLNERRQSVGLSEVEQTRH